MMVFPFAMRMIPILARSAPVDGYFGAFYLVSGIAVALANLLLGALLDRTGGTSTLFWLILASIGAASAIGLALLFRLQNEVLPQDT